MAATKLTRGPTPEPEQGTLAGPGQPHPENAAEHWPGVLLGAAFPKSEFSLESNEGDSELD